MEFINKIELRGIVGTSTLNRVGDAQVCRFSIATEYSHKDRDGNPVVDTTWFNVTAWEDKNIPDLRPVVRGAIVQVSGRVRTYKYTTAAGEEKSSWEVFARRITILQPDDDPMQPQRFL
jgi:single-strand DNA-binding protein